MATKRRAAKAKRPAAKQSADDFVGSYSKSGAWVTTLVLSSDGTFTLRSDNSGFGGSQGEVDRGTWSVVALDTVELHATVRDSYYEDTSSRDRDSETVDTRQRVTFQRDAAGAIRSVYCGSSELTRY